MQNIINEIHQSPHKVVFAITGGGVNAISRLLEYGDGSNTVLDAQIPYCTNAFQQFIGGQPDKFCSLPAARSLATAAFQRARKLSPDTPINHLIGIGATCSLRKASGERPGRKHHAYIAAQTSSTSYAIAAELTDVFRNLQEIHVATEIILLLAEICDVRYNKTDYNGFWNTFDKKVANPPNDLIERVFNGLCDSSSIILNECANERCELLFPGAFNPLHTSHIKIAEIAHQHTGKIVDLEISVKNVDKPPLDYFSINERINQIKEMTKGNPAIGQLYLTNAPKFYDKSLLYPGVQFIVGYDTLKRLNDCKYYTNNKLAIWEEMQKAGTKFLVFYRQDENIDVIHDKLIKMCSIIPTNVYNDADAMSSSKIRNQNGN